MVIDKATKSDNSLQENITMLRDNILLIIQTKNKREKLKHGTKKYKVALCLIN
jgi:hypothetical protein